MKTICSSLEILEARIAPAQFIVTTLKDISNHQHTTGSLRDAILLANDSPGADTVIFQKHNGQPLKGAITLHSDLPVITDAVTITGPLVNNLIALTINGHKHQVFNVDNSGGVGFDASFSNLKITKAEATFGAAFYLDDYQGHLLISNCIITGNKAASKASIPYGDGGGIFQSTGELTIMGSQITNNIAKGTNGSKKYQLGQASGGGIFSSGDLTIKDSIISGNLAKAGNGVKKAGGYGQGTGGFAKGGGLYIDVVGATVTIDNTVISNNQAIGGLAGNGVKGAKGIKGAPGANGGQGGQGSIGGKGGSAYGGGIWFYAISYQGNLTISNSTISGNSVTAMSGGKGGDGGAGGTGGLAAPGHHAGAGGDGGAGGTGGSNGLAMGGGIFAAYGSAIVQNSTISGNTVTTGKAGTGGVGGQPGPGAYTVGGRVHRGMPGEPGADGDYDDAMGGGIYSNSYLTLSQVTIAENRAPHGGGLFVDYGTSIHNSTIAQNIGSIDGGGLVIASGTIIDIISTIISANTAATHNDASGTFLAKFDLIEDATGVTTSAGSTNNITGVSAQLGTLADNGGPTRTMLPAVASLVIGMGSNPDNLMTDQRGDPRVLPASGGIIDIGAVEAA